MEYKDTLNLPKTDFPMKADLPKREPNLLADWVNQDIYARIREKSKNKPRYILHDGPPYANGDIHIGHALNKTLKDIVVKYKTMKGFDSAYVPGWDCHGLPIEHQLFKELKISKYQIGQVEFRKKAHEYAMKHVANQREQFKRLGVFADWENPYLTLSKDYEEAIVSSFNELFKKGYIQRGLKPVNWCFKCETALAEAEVEYENHTSPSVFVKFKLDNPFSGGEAKDYLLIWTTTPWTLIANVAVAVHPDLVYVYVKTDRGNLILSKDLLPKVFAQAGIDKYEVVKEVDGEKLAGLVYTHPFGLRKGKVVLADYVSKEEGSGLVHTAPGHGAEDFQTGLKHGLEVVMPVDSRGKFDTTAGEFSGINVYEANKLIIEKLQALDVLLLESKIQHSYPHCWRCKNPIIFRATKQWFMIIDHNDLRKSVLESIKNDVKWIPASGQERISAMVESRPDWCLSRQRYWGVPVPAIVCNNCHEEFFDAKVIDTFASFVAKEGTDCWFEREIKDFLHEGIVCTHCAGKNFSKGTDILDVWFDSGVSHQAVLKKREALGGTPCELYLEGSDQHRGWFQSSLIPAMAIDGKPPFRNVLTHGHVVDSQGKKMSKSLGNVISPHDIIKDYGVDVLRLWVAASDYNEDIRISKEMLARLSEAYRKIRNTVRFILSNLYDFDPEVNKIEYVKLRKIDKWILWRLEFTRDSVDKAYADFEFNKAYKLIYDFCNEDLSMYYLDMVKGRLYTYAADSLDRRAAQTAVFEVLNYLVRLIAPILVFTADEIWKNMPKERKDKSLDNVHLLGFPGVNPVFRQDDLESSGKKNIDEELKLIIELVPDLAKSLEDKRTKGDIGSSFDAQINLLTKTQERYTFLSSLKEDLCEIFKVSEVTISKVDNFPAEATSSTRLPDVGIIALKADGNKCVRCWNYAHSVGEDKEHPLLCNNCLTAIGGTHSEEKA